VALIGSNYSGDLTSVLHGILEEYEIHDCINVIVLSQGEVESISEGIDVGELIVKLFIEAMHEVGKDERLRSSTEEFLNVSLELGE
jgi:hypothetical protein